MPFDYATFVKPIAHRGLHDAARGIIENAGKAFELGLSRGYGVECDLQPAADGTPMVYHDDEIDRLMTGSGRLDRLSVPALQKLTYKVSGERMLTFAEFLELCGGRGPLFVEIKSNWKKPKTGFLENIASIAKRYKGPLALMSFDPRVMAAMAELAPGIPRGIVSGKYAGKGWSVDALGADRAFRLTNLLESGPAAPSFYAYHVKALPTPVTRYVREVAGIPVFTWTVRTAEDRKVAREWADAAIFEGGGA